MSSIRLKSNPIHAGAELCRDFISLFFPNYCLGCTNTLVKGEEILCTRCILELPKTQYHLDLDNPIHKRLEGRIHLKTAIAFLRFRKTGVVQHLLHQLKYNNHPEVGIRLGKLYGKELFDAGFKNYFDLIVPVPLHETRRRKRGYNQSARFAEGLSATLQIPYDEKCVVRIVKTTTQTRKNKIDRWNNVKDVFHVAHPETINQKRILLVDDVITTGATMEACGLQLLENGCAELSFACLAEAQ